MAELTPELRRKALENLIKVMEQQIGLCEDHITSAKKSLEALND